MMNSETSGHKIGCNVNIPDAGKLNAIEKAGEKPGEKVVISLDIADSEFDRDRRYRLALKDSDLDSAGMIDAPASWRPVLAMGSLKSARSPVLSGWLNGISACG